jgi:UDP-N-acetylmuramoyl-L-alanyl-D-glutamate--2,6-diaminopimelate ligase
VQSHEELAVTLKELLVKTGLFAELPDLPQLSREVTGVKTNSHVCQPGDLFVGMPGTRVDGGEFWRQAIEAGAIAAVISPAAAAKAPPTATDLVLTAEDLIAASAALAGAFYDYPTSRLSLVGVTGTNGKTTTTHSIEYMLQRASKSPALFGTLYSRWQGFELTATHTTPFAVDLQKLFADALAAGCDYGIMEVSSHALAQGRVLGCPFAVSVFTNLTQDHLDYHKDMEDYFQAKALLFSEKYLKGKAIVNADDTYGQRIIASLPTDRVWSYSVSDPQASLYTTDLEFRVTGVTGTLHTPVGSIAFTSPLIGDYNLENVLAAAGTVLALGIELPAVAEAIASFPGVPGRMERVRVSDRQDVSAFVDYAHTPDSLENVLKASRPFVSGNLICVFGCGGDRDRTKRPQMGKIAADLADRAIVTSDNPRTEDPGQILQDIIAGITDDKNVEVIADRAAAIARAIASASANDAVIIAGKGHEDYQILGTEKIHFDDREQARIALQKRFGS